MSGLETGEARQSIGERLRVAAELAPDRLPRLVAIAEDWAKRGGEALGEIAVVPVAVELDGIAIAGAPFENDGEAPAGTGALLTSRKFPVPGFVTADGQIAEVAIGAFFGGDLHTPQNGRRQSTDLDTSLVSLALSTLTKAAREVFQPLADLPMESGALLASGALVEAAGDGAARFVSFRFSLKAGGRASLVTFALPESFIAPHRRALSQMPDRPAAAEDEDWSRDMEAGLARADMSVHAVLARQMLPLSRIASLAVGQTIELDAGIDSLIALECEEQCLFRGRVGRSRDTYVVRIEQKVDPAEEFFDDILSH